MTTRYTQNELAAMEQNLDRDATGLKAEILELATGLAAIVTEAYNGGYQEDQKLLARYRRQLADILDGSRLLGDAAGTLITAGVEHDHE